MKSCYLLRGTFLNGTVKESHDEIYRAVCQLCLKRQPIKVRRLVDNYNWLPFWIVHEFPGCTWMFAKFIVIVCGSGKG